MLGTKIFRLFVSSTFSDFQEERNALHREVFPRLRLLCEGHGCRFQAIDLRWGISEEASSDQRTMGICFEEIARCLKTTARPYFLALLGDRYGWRPLPSRIPAAEFQEILGAVPPQQRRLLTSWYVEDGNAVPPERYLRSREPGEQAGWGEVESGLRQVLRDAASSLPLPPAERLKYFASATEQEIVRGGLESARARDGMFCCLRAITGLPEGKSAGCFRDLDRDGAPVLEARERLDRLKTELRRQLAGNVYEVQARWRGAGLATDHLERFCGDLYERLSQAIEEEVASARRLDPVRREAEAHDLFGTERARHFTGRVEALGKIAAYLDEGIPRVLAIVGPPGSGKSALIARAVERTRARLPDAVVVARFIGVTPRSSNTRSLLESLTAEIAESFGDPAPPPPEGYKALVQELTRQLARARPDRPLIVFLDALDILPAGETGSDLDWLPAHLPDHVRLVVTVTPGQKAAAVVRRATPVNTFELTPMPPDEGRELLDLWLGSVNRGLRSDQKTAILERFRSHGLPLYLKLAFEESRRWRSTDELVDLPGDVPGIIRALFQRLASDADHGETLVSHSLGYLAGARNGVSDDEMIDLLSLDHEVYDDVVAGSRYRPPDRRIPTVVWSRLFFDLEPYLAEREADGALLLTFYHRQLREVVEADELAGERGRRFHQKLAAYFAARPIDRRKLAELPYQQTLGELWEALAATLSDFELLAARCAGGPMQDPGGESDGVYELQRDLRFAVDRWSPEEAGRGEMITEILLAVVREQNNLRRHPRLFFQQVYPYLRWSEAASLAELRRRCEEHAGVYGARAPWLRRLNRPLPLSSLELTLSPASSPVTCLRFLPSEGLLAAGTEDGEVFFWELSTGRSFAVESGGGRVCRLVLREDGQEPGLLAVCMHGLVAIDPRSRQTTSFSRFSAMTTVADSAGSLVCVGDHLGRMETWDIRSGMPVSHRWTRRIPIKVLSFSGDGESLLAVNSGGLCFVQRRDTGEVRAVPPQGSRIRVAVPASPGPGWWVGRHDGSCERLEGPGLQPVEKAPIEAAGPVACGVLAERGRVLALGTEGGLATLWNMDDHAARPAGFRLDEPVVAVAVSQDLDLVAAADRRNSGEVHRISELDGNREARGLLAGTPPVFLPDSEGLVVGCRDGAPAIVPAWREDGSRGKDAPRRLPGRVGFAGHAAGALICGRWAASGYHGSWRAWDAWSEAPLGGHNASGAGAVSAIAVSPAGDLVVTAHSEGWLVVCDIESGAERRREPIRGGAPSALAFDTGGSRLFVAGSDGSLTSWRLQATKQTEHDVMPYVVGGAGGLLLKVDLVEEWTRNLPGPAQAMAVTRDDRLLAVCGEEAVAVFQARDGSPLDGSGEQGGGCVDLDFSPDSSHLAAVSRDGSCYVWDLQHRRLSARFETSAMGLGVAWRPDGGEIAVTTHGGEILSLSFEHPLPGLPIVPVFPGVPPRFLCPDNRCPKRSQTLLAYRKDRVISCTGCGKAVRTGSRVRPLKRFWERTPRKITSILRGKS